MTWPLTKRIEDYLDRVEGLIPNDVGLYLAEQASLVEPPNWIINIGVYKGKSVGYLSAGAAEGVSVFGIDPWDMPGNQTGRFRYANPATRAACLLNIRRMIDFGVMKGESVFVEQDFSTKAAEIWDKPVGLVFIDGDHGYDSVLNDGLAWFPYVVKKGKLILDDYDTPRNPGVKQAAERLSSMWKIPYTVEVERLAVFDIP